MNFVLLDRDGTVIVDPPDLRVDSIEKIKLFPDTIEALKLLADNDFAVIMITNQAGIAEGLLTDHEFHTIQEEVLQQLQPSGVTILDTYMCPHDADDNCKCHKPKPTMLLDAAEDFDFDITTVYMVGDRLSDIDAGINAGAKTILVKTANTPVEAPEATYTALNLLDAVEYIING